MDPAFPVDLFDEFLHHQELIQVDEHVWNQGFWLVEEHQVWHFERKHGQPAENFHNEEDQVKQHPTDAHVHAFLDLILNKYVKLY